MKFYVDDYDQTTTLREITTDEATQLLNNEYAQEFVEVTVRKQYFQQMKERGQPYVQQVIDMSDSTVVIYFDSQMDLYITP